MLPACSKCGTVPKIISELWFCSVGGEPVCCDLDEKCCRVVRCHAFGRDGCDGIDILCQNEECLKLYKEGKIKHCARCFEAVPYHRIRALNCPQPVKETLLPDDPRCKGKTHKSNRYCARCNVPVCYHQNPLRFCACIGVRLITDNDGKQICHTCYAKDPCGQRRDPNDI